MRRRVASVVAVFISAWCFTAQAGPWIRNPGDAYVKLGAARTTSDQGFDAGLATGLSYEAYRYNIYSEVGLGKGLQLVADIPYLVAINAASSGARYKNHTFGDATIELDYGFTKKWPLAAGLVAKIPLYDRVGQAQLPENLAGLGPSNFPNAGNAEIDITPKMLAGWSAHPIPAWINGELGYTIRLGGYADGIYASLSGGYFVIPDTLAVGFYSNGTINTQADADPLVRAAPQYLYAQGYLLGQLKELSPNFSATLGVGGVVAAKNSGKSLEVSLGLAYETDR